MNIQQRQWRRDDGWQIVRDPADGGAMAGAQLVLAFGDVEAIDGGARLAELRAFHPAAHIVQCSTAGEILDTAFAEHTVSATAIRFDAATCSVASLDVASCAGSLEAGHRLADAIDRDGLVHVLAMAGGPGVDAGELLRGLAESFGASVAVTGGMAGDGLRFGRTLVGVDAPPREGMIAIVGLYGASLRVGFGSMAGWESFGPERAITCSAGNVLHELDGTSALELYKRYLGDRAAELPGVARLFPLSVSTASSEKLPVRRVLAVDEAAGSVTFDGEIPQGGHARLMKANVDRLIDGAANIAGAGLAQLGGASVDLALLFSNVGRRLVLGQHTDEEIEAARSALGPACAIAGFYSYGGIGPFADSSGCELHNQTMSVTTLSELGDV